MIDGHLKASKLFYLGCTLKLLAIALSLLQFSAYTVQLPISTRFESDLAPFWGWLVAGIGELTGSGSYPPLVSAAFVFLIDIIILVFLLRLISNQHNMVLTLYWLSPAIIVQTYLIRGFELVPIAAIVLGLAFLRESKLGLSGLSTAIATTLNPTLACVLTFVAISMWQQKRIRTKLPLFLKTFCATLAIYFIINYLASLFYNRVLKEVDINQAVTNLNYTPDIGFSIYPLVLLYLVSVYLMWRLQRSSFGTLMTIIGLYCLAFMILTGGVEFWFLVALPFLTWYATKTTRTGQFILTVTQIFVAIYLLSKHTTMPDLGGQELVSYNIDLAVNWIAIIPTAISSLSVVLIMRMVSEGVIFSNYHRVTRKSFVFGIAGDSGSGKDTLSRAIAGLFDTNSVTTIYGDAYHKWDRNAPMWKTLTHLNPLANDLAQLTKDVVAVTSGETLHRRHYDHRSGRFTFPIQVRGNDVVLVTGLHALFESQLRDRLDVKIFLATDTELRLHWKINRDTNAREHNREKVLSIESVRENDRSLYISPQEKYADLVFRLMPVNPRYLDTKTNKVNPPLKLLVRMRDSMEYESLIRCLIAICGLQIDWEILNDGRTVELLVEGDVSADDIQLSARTLFKFNEHLSFSPAWRGDMLGVMQLAILTYMQQKLFQRIKE